MASAMPQAFYLEWVLALATAAETIPDRLSISPAKARRFHRTENIFLAAIDEAHMRSGLLIRRKPDPHTNQRRGDLCN
jgi:hypothetical protein